MNTVGGKIFISKMFPFIKDYIIYYNQELTVL